jgi:hypothetical protein
MKTIPGPVTGAVCVSRTARTARPVRAIRAAVGLASVVAGVAILAGCSAVGPETTVAPPVESQLTAAPTPKPETFPDILPTTGPSDAAIPADVQGPPVDASTVAGLVKAVDSAAHPSLAVCDGQYASVVAGRGDLSSRGDTEYLVDTTCAGSTGTSPDEVAVYGGTRLERVAVVYAYTANRPRLTTYPYLAGLHLVVLQYADGAQYSLVRLSPSGVAQGPLENA